MSANELKLAMAKTRLDVLTSRGEKNIKCPGVVRKLKRKIRNLSKLV